MSLNGSKGTSAGMRQYYAKIPRCRNCKTKKLVKHPCRDLGYCTGCFEKLTGEKLKNQYSLHWNATKPKETSYFDFIQWLKLKIKASIKPY